VTLVADSQKLMANSFSSGFAILDQRQALLTNVIPVLGRHLAGFATIFRLLEKHLQARIEAFIHRERVSGADPQKNPAVLMVSLEESHGGVDDFIGGAILAALQFFAQPYATRGRGSHSQWLSSRTAPTP